VLSSSVVENSANCTASFLADPGSNPELAKGELTMTDVLILRATPEMIHHWGWFLVFGIVLLSLGIAAIVRSVAATVVSMVFFGWLLVFASLIQFVDAFMVGKSAGFFLDLLIAILLGITGVLMLTRPVISAEAVTLVMSMFFLIAGLYQLIASLWAHLPGWGWQALSGVVTSILGVLVLAGWPVSGLWVIGLFVGIDLIFYGWAWIALALDLRKM
jgi:uncharacterized membrane protein HdeD (DUF308 family)